MSGIEPSSTEVDYSAGATVPERDNSEQEAASTPHSAQDEVELTPPATGVAADITGALEKAKDAFAAFLGAAQEVAAHLQTAASQVPPPPAETTEGVPPAEPVAEPVADPAAIPPAPEEA